MSVHFCVLGSGSSGNSALVMTPGLHVLIDAGFPPDELAARLDGTGASWASLDAILLTHMHGDHLKKRCLALCAEHEIRFFCHASHAAQLSGSRYFKRLRERNLVHTHDGTGTLELKGAADSETALRLQPLLLSHDAPPTLGFLIEARGADGWKKLGYLTDLGVCEPSLAGTLADVDLLALEFNHDEELERKSGRHPRLIERVLGDEGHLSNRQAAEVFQRVLEKCANGGPKLLLQMHLSRDCNSPELAYQAAQEVLLMTGAQTRIFSTRQDRRGTVHSL